MKFLEIPTLADLTADLCAIDTGDLRIIGRVEAYSCKKAGSDKKLYKTLEREYSNEIASSPHADLATSPFGPLNDRETRRTLIYLTSTLNASFPDYDFNFKILHSDEFKREESYEAVVYAVDTALSSLKEDYHTTIRPKLWPAIEAEIVPSECHIFSFVPETDPFADIPAIWSVYFFFYNRRLKRVLFFSSRAISKLSSSMSGAMVLMPTTDRGDMDDIDASDEDLAFMLE